jgi:hypothetical protein
MNRLRIIWSRIRATNKSKTRLQPRNTRSTRKKTRPQSMPQESGVFPVPEFICSLLSISVYSEYSEYSVVYSTSTRLLPKADLITTRFLIQHL